MAQKKTDDNPCNLPDPSEFMLGMTESEASLYLDLRRDFDPKIVKPEHATQVWVLVKALLKAERDGDKPKTNDLTLITSLIRELGITAQGNPLARIRSSRVDDDSEPPEPKRKTRFGQFR